MENSNQSAIAWHFEVLPASAKRAIKYLSGEEWLRRSKWYLAGGTALTLQAGHRSSVDLDFFTQNSQFSAAKLIERFPKKIFSAGIIREGTIYGKLLNAKISFISYPFFVPREDYLYYGALPVLDERDIAVMKIIAISQRGRKRDFIDLYWYCVNREPLLNVLRRVPEQYATVTHNFHHIIKALSYFADAEAEPMPKVFFDADWKKVKKFFESETRKAARELLGIK